jgi:hypothetical protein
MPLLDLFRRIARRSEGANPEVRMASVYRRRGKYYVTASSKTRDGFWLEEGPVDVLDDVAAVAGAVRTALQRSTHGIRSPKDWSNRVNGVVEAAGMKRYSAFAKDAAYVSVDQKDGVVRLVPSRNGGSREGFLGLEEQAVTVANDGDLADAIESAFDRCS